MLFSIDQHVHAFNMHPLAYKQHYVVRKDQAAQLHHKISLTCYFIDHFLYFREGQGMASFDPLP